jgi:hypothetical protein
MDEAPLITVRRGSAAPDEVAAVVAVVAVLLAAAPAPEPVRTAAAGPASAWTDRDRTRHDLPRPGPRAWRAAALPR